MFKYYIGNMAIIIDQYGPLFMIYHNMCDGCMDRRMDVHTDRRMSGRTDEITNINVSHIIHIKASTLLFLISVNLAILKGWVEKNRIRNTRS
jgi:hypothetical protein